MFVTKRKFNATVNSLSYDIKRLNDYCDRLNELRLQNSQRITDLMKYLNLEEVKKPAETVIMPISKIATEFDYSDVTVTCSGAGGTKIDM